ncbi:hypothetical protein BT96DRAFT_947596 [Gymnopus androsaceus JB14]|uniref:Uncharacterized protein n=1 Tax=Gymnopus androsaceus JB14 TaxID=1447944 RepID=A0A6A4GTE9_9AGAR|nr:hypothetical protein BT96DRAFT_947596 [Gymnopus androsaceus JB14]
MQLQKEHKHFMCLITPRLASEPFAEAKNKKLFLPSDFALAEHSELCLEALASKQVNILDVALGEVVTLLQTVVKTISAAFERKIKHAKGQEQNTCSLDEAKWPTLEKEDTYQKSMEKQRRPGDPTNIEGNLWSLTSAGLVAKLNKHGKVFGDNLADVMEKEDNDDEIKDPTFKGDGHYLAQVISKLQQPPPKKAAPVQELEPDTKEESVRDNGNGWIWVTQSQNNMSKEEVGKWLNKCDSIQDAWGHLADNFSTSPGHVAYAKEHSNKYETLRMDAVMKYTHGSIPFLRKRPNEVTLSDQLLVWRSKENKHFIVILHF